MYREDRKNGFIEQYKNKDTRRTVASVFAALEPFENEFGKDVSEMTESELRHTLDETLAVSSISRYSKLLYLQKYVEWCRAAGFKGVTNAVFTTNAMGLDKIRRQFTASPAHLQRCLDIAYAPVEAETVDIIYRCYLWLGYMEFPEGSIPDLTKSNLDFNSCKLVFGGRSYILYQEAIPAFHKATDLTEFNYHHDSPSYDIKRSRFPSNELLRGIKSGFQKTTIRAKTTHKVIEFADSDTPVEQLGYKRLTTSGMFYRVYSRERAGLPVSPKQEFYKVFLDRGIKASSAATMANAYYSDYARWKAAFSI